MDYCFHYHGLHYGHNNAAVAADLSTDSVDAAAAADILQNPDLAATAMVH
jgi:hypothetical protein